MTPYRPPLPQRPR